MEEGFYVSGCPVKQAPNGQNSSKIGTLRGGRLALRRMSNGAGDCREDK